MYNNVKQKNILKMVEYQKNKNNEFKDFFEELSDRYEIILIGGALRDALNQDFAPRDIDIIINDSNLDEFDKLLFEFKINYKNNRFGGYKLFFEDVQADVWSINKHYAFEHNYYQENVKNIVETTFLNYDSIVYDYKNKMLYDECYQECLEKKVIDLIGEEDYIEDNPTPDVNIARMLKIKNETNYIFSDRVVDYINQYYDKNCERKKWIIQYKLCKSFETHYKKKIDKKLFDILEQVLCDN